MDGAPQGILQQPKDPGIFPDRAAPADMRPGQLHCDEKSFRNYPGVEEQDITEQKMQAHLGKNHLEAFDAYEQITHFVVGKLVLSEIGLIAKTRNGITKARAILDTKESGVKGITAKTQRVIFARPLDAVLRMLFLLALATSATVSVSSFVLDFKYAFWQMLIRKEERRFFCATAIIKGRRKFLAFLRAVQGSANAPMLWARQGALIMRMIQALFDPEDLNPMCYVDDPTAALRGTEGQRMVVAATMVLVWEAMGFGLAYAKCQLDHVVRWIGGTLSCDATGVQATVK